METVPEPDDEYLRHTAALRRIVEARLQAEGLLFTAEIFKDDALINRLTSGDDEDLRADGLDPDSLDWVEVFLEMKEDFPPEPEDGEGSGGLGVREPLRPLPNAGSGAVELALPQVSTQGPDYYERRTEIDLNTLPLSDIETEAQGTEEPIALTMEERHAQQRELATKLGPYVGKWVMVQGAEVVASASTPDELLKNNRDIEADRMFLVLDGKKKYILGRRKAA